MMLLFDTELGARFVRYAHMVARRGYVHQSWDDWDEDGRARPVCTQAAIQPA